MKFEDLRKIIPERQILNIITPEDKHYILFKQDLFNHIILKYIHDYELITLDKLLVKSIYVEDNKLKIELIE